MGNDANFQALLHELHALQHRRREIDMNLVMASESDAGGGGGRFTSRQNDPDGEDAKTGREGRRGGVLPGVLRSGTIAHDQRVEELFDLCERWRLTASVLPSVVDRLKALKSLHQEAGGISVRLSGQSGAIFVRRLGKGHQLQKKERSPPIHTRAVLCILMSDKDRQKEAKGGREREKERSHLCAYMCVGQVCMYAGRCLCTCI